MNFFKKIFPFLLVIFFLSFIMFCKKPENLGINNKKLLKCPNTPNCVCSQCDKNDKLHYILPIVYDSSKEEAYEKMKKLIELDKNTKIVKRTNNYIYAEYRSKIFRFVDDVEFYFFENEKLIHVRSASRLGKSDFGVNRKRIEKLRESF